MSDQEENGSAKKKLKVLIGGFAGGFATQLIIPLQNSLTSHRFGAIFTTDYWLLGAVFGLIGLVVVWLLSENDVKKAVLLGLSLPSLVANYGAAIHSTAPHQNDISAPFEMKGGTGLPLGVVPFVGVTAFAQGTPSPVAFSKGPSRSIEANIDGQLFSYTMELLDDQGNVVGSAIEADPSKSLLVAQPLPENVAQVRFTAGSATLVKKLQPKDGFTVDVTLSGDGFQRKFGFAQAFGKPPAVVPAELRAEAHLRPKAPTGLQGWIYVGHQQNGSWDPEHTVEGQNPPAVGETLQIVFAANVRDAARSKNRPLGIVSVFQQVKFLQVQNGNGIIWGQIAVQ
ncbi:MAG: hypothetical protein H0X34_14880 [Chthoniobacterales bacterium]|jgi:hypothetical protein|nr:hypothetical protein [Chthoniobacterales bacterium]